MFKHKIMRPKNLDGAPVLTRKKFANAVTPQSEADHQFSEFMDTAKNSSRN